MVGAGSCWEDQRNPDSKFSDSDSSDRPPLVHCPFSSLNSTYADARGKTISNRYSIFFCNIFRLLISRIVFGSICYQKVEN